MKLIKMLAVMLAIMLLGMSAGFAASLEDMIYQDIRNYEHPDGKAPYYVGQMGYSEQEWWSAAKAAYARAQEDGIWPSWWDKGLNPVFTTDFADLVSTIKDELWFGKYPHDMMELMVTDEGSLTGEALCTVAEWQAAAAEAVRQYREDRGLYTYDFEEAYLDGSFFVSAEYLAHLESIGVEQAGGDYEWSFAESFAFNPIEISGVWSPDDFVPGEPVWVDCIGGYAWRNLDGTFDDYFYEDIFGKPKASSARDLGDESIPMYVLCGLAAVALAGVVIANKKRVCA